MEYVNRYIEKYPALASQTSIQKLWRMNISKTRENPSCRKMGTINYGRDGVKKLLPFRRKKSWTVEENQDTKKMVAFFAPKLATPPFSGAGTSWRKLSRLDHFRQGGRRGALTLGEMKQLSSSSSSQQRHGGFLHKPNLGQNWTTWIAWISGYSKNRTPTNLLNIVFNETRNSRKSPLGMVIPSGRHCGFCRVVHFSRLSFRGAIPLRQASLAQGELEKVGLFTSVETPTL